MAGRRGSGTRKGNEWSWGSRPCSPRTPFPLGRISAQPLDIHSPALRKSVYLLESQESCSLTSGLEFTTQVRFSRTRRLPSACYVDINHSIPTRNKHLLLFFFFLGLPQRDGSFFLGMVSTKWASLSPLSPIPILLSFLFLSLDHSWFFGPFLALQTFTDTVYPLLARHQGCKDNVCSQHPSSSTAPVSDPGCSICPFCGYGQG